MYIVTPEAVPEHSTVLGVKTVNLARLQCKGFKTFPFVAVPYDSFSTCLDDHGEVCLEQVTQLAEKIHAMFPQKQYAVRSSALVEDGDASSNAGQFTTKLAVPYPGLGVAVGEVLQHAYGVLQGDMRQFSLLVQQFQVPQYAGVVFSRNPTGSRETVVDYVEGVGDSVVAGGVSAPVYVCEGYIRSLYTIPTQLRHRLLELASVARCLETLFAFPQDIEWAIVQGAIYILQSRPITSVTNADYQESLLIEDALPKAPFYFEKNRTVESFDRPVPLATSMLRCIHADGGPVQKVYAKYGIQYVAQEIFVSLRTELYVDKEKELQTLFPAYTYFKTYNGTPRMGSWKGVWRSLLHMQQLRRLPLGCRSALEKEISAELGKASAIQGVAEEETWTKFLQVYQIIFEVNLLAEKAFEDLRQVASEVGESVSGLLVTSCGQTQESKIRRILQPEELSACKGNSLNIADTTPFVTSTLNTKDRTLGVWWHELSAKKQQEYNQVVQYAQVYEQLRECARWLTVLHVNNFRKYAYAVAKKSGFVSPEDVLFSTIEEIVTGTLSHDRYR